MAGSILRPPKKCDGISRRGAPARALTRSATVALLVLAFAPSISFAGDIPGSIDKSRSEFDGTVQLAMEPAWVRDSSMKFGLLWHSDMQAGELVLAVVVEGAELFGDGESLHFNVDGAFHHLRSIDESTDIETTGGSYAAYPYSLASNWSSKRYVVTESFVRTLLDAKRVIVRLDLDRKFVEGTFSKDGFTTARPAFRKFMKELGKVRASAATQ